MDCCRKRKMGVSDDATFFLKKRNTCLFEDEDVSTDELCEWLADVIKSMDSVNSRQQALELRMNVARVKQIIVSRLSDITSA